MKKKLLSGLFWVLLANLIVKPLWLLGIEVGVQNRVGNEMYGFYFAVLNLSYILNILLDLGITNFNTRNIAQHPQLIEKHLSGILCVKVALLGLYLLVAFSIGAMMGYGSQEFRLLAWLCLAQFLNSLILYLRSNFEGLLLFKWDSLFSVLDRLLMIVICGFMLWGPTDHWPLVSGHFTIYHFIYAQVAAYGITALLAFAVIARKTHFRRLRWNWPFFLVILRKSAPFALLVLLMASYNRIDSLLLVPLAGKAEAGIYAGAFRLLDALTMIAYLVSVPLLPVYARLCREDKGQIADITRIVFLPMMLFAVGVSVALSLLSQPVMGLLYPGQAALYAPVFRIIIFGIIPISLTYIFGTLLTAGGHLKKLNILAVMSLVLNVAVNLILIPHLGAVGSAWASLVAQTFMAVAQLILAIRLFNIPLSTFRIPKVADIKKLFDFM